MGVTSTNRRERVRHVDGTVTDLPGAEPATGLSAIASATAGVASLSGAAVAATYGEAMVPHAEATLGWESTEVTASSHTLTLTGTSTDLAGWTVIMNPAADSDPAGPAPKTYLKGRGVNAGWPVMLADVGIADDPRSQAGPLDRGQAPDVAAPWILRPTAGFKRLLANPAADPADVPWVMMGAQVDENVAADPMYALGSSWPQVGGTRSTSTTGGLNGARYANVTGSGATADVQVFLPTYGGIGAGEVASVAVWMRGPVGAVVQLGVYFREDGQAAPTAAQRDGHGSSVEVTLTSATVWTAYKLENVRNPLTVPAQVTVMANVRALASGVTVSIDSVKVRREDRVGTFGAGGTTSEWSWLGTANVSPSVRVVGTSPGSYARFADPLAPALGLTPSSVVHRRTAAAIFGERLSSPWGVCAYTLASPRLFTVAGWVRFTPPASGSQTPPLLRWVVEFYDSAGTGQWAVARSAAFAPASTVYLRHAATFTLPAAAKGVMDRARAHLEIVASNGGTGAMDLSLRGAQLYAGSDRGDTEGLKAVPLPTPLTWVAYGGTTPMQRVNRIDVHGCDRISQITAATVSATFPGVSPNSYAGRASGASAGRLTVRGIVPPALAVSEVATRLDVTAEECNAGPSGDLSFQNVVGWFETDVSDRLVGLEVDRAADIDPASSTVPVGNYAASTVSLTLDDPDGELDLFTGTYIDTGHRIDTAAGVVYTNRHDDPGGVVAHAAGVTSAAWPTAPTGVSPVVPTTADRYGQVPPAAYAARVSAAFAGATPLATTAPAQYGQTVRARVWFRWAGGSSAPTITLAGCVVSFVSAAAGWSVYRSGVGTFASFPWPSGGLPEADRWYLLDLGEVTIDQAANAAAITCTTFDTTAGLWVELAAPTFERLTDRTSVGGELVEVVETAPMGVFYSTSYSDGTGAAEVQVQGVDVLAARGAQSLPEAMVLSSTVDAYTRDLARTYFDLGDDQVVIVDQGTALTYAVPASEVSTMLADLAKLANLTAFTDGLGRLSMLLRSETTTDYLTEYLGSRNLLEATSAIAPDQVVNDVTVTVHPVTVAAAVTELGVAGRVDPIANGTPYVLDAADTPIPTGADLELFIERGAAINLSAIVQLGMVTGIVTDTLTAVTVTVTHFASSTKVAIHNGRAGGADQTVYLVRAAVSGKALTEGTVGVRKVRQASVDAFGRRTSTVDVRLARTTGPAAGIADTVLEAYSLRDPSGERWLPDLEATVLGDPWRELGDRVLVADTDSGLSGEFRVVSHTYTYGIGADSSLYLRRTPTGLLYLVADIDKADDAHVTSY